MEIKGTSGVVTGAASGLGRATAERLVQSGASLVLIDRDEKRLDELLNSLDGKHLAMTADICDPDAINSALKLGTKILGELRFVINCAGIPSSAKTVSRGVAHDLKLWKKIIDVNLTGTFNVLSLAAELMCKNSTDLNGERGVIVNTSSVTAYDGQKGQAAYAASKAAIAGMSLPIARDLSDHGIRCMAIAPGLFETELLAAIPQKGIDALSRDLLFPKRMGMPIEFAEMVVSILANPYVNGTCYRLDGGVRLGN